MDNETIKTDAWNDVLDEMAQKERNRIRAWLTERVFSLEQLYNADIPEIAWIVKDLITEGITVLAGMLKAGKSYLVVNIGLAVAEGRQALGTHDVKQGRVLYITPDDKQQARLRARIKQMREGRTDAIPFDIATNWTLLDEGGTEEIAEYLDYYPDTQMVIIDVLMSVLPGISEDANAYDRIYQKLEPLKRLAQERHIAIVLVMHMNKGGKTDSNPRNRIYGSMAYGAIADNILMLDEDYSTHKRYLMTSGKDLDQRRDLLDFNRDTGVYSYGTARIAQIEEQKDSQDIAAYVRENPGARFSQIKKWLVAQGLEEPAADQRIRRARNAGDICQFPGKQGYYPCDYDPFLTEQ